MNLRSILMLLLLLLSGFSSFGCSASQSNANAGTEPFEIFTEHTNKQTEAKAWATCATIYSLHEQALEDGYPAIAKLQRNRATGARLAIILAFSLHFLLDETIDLDSRVKNYQKAYKYAQTNRNDWLQLEANRLAAVNESSPEEFARIFGEELDKCIFNLDGQEYYIEVARELAIRFGSDEG